MASLTLTIDAAVLRRARIRALEQGTSVNALVAGYLAAFAGEQERQRRAVRTILAVAAEVSRAGKRGRARRRRGQRWTRDELHDR
jgi:hypothetical protein